MIRGFFLFTVILFCCCSSENDNKKIIKNPNSVSRINVPVFNEDSAYFFIQEQVDFGPRFLSSPGWEKCSFYLENKLKTYTKNVFVQEAPTKTYDNKKHTLKNIIASFSPEKNNRIALMAHWDTRHIADYDTINQDKPILGANDGGSGVAVLLELARAFHLEKPNIGIDLILFDAEDYGQPENSTYPTMQNSWCLGSQYWSKNPHKKNYFAKYGILLDMVGAKDAVFTFEETSHYYNANLLKRVWKKGHQLGYGNHFSFTKTKQIIDDHYYVNLIAGIPTIDIIEYDLSTQTNFNRYWHTHGDNMNNVNRETLKAVGQTLIHIIYSE